MTPRTRLLYVQDALPVFQNQMYDSAAEGRECPKGDMRLVKRGYPNSRLGLNGVGIVLRHAQKHAPVKFQSSRRPANSKGKRDLAFLAAQCRSFFISFSEKVIADLTFLRTPRGNRNDAIRLHNGIVECLKTRNERSSDTEAGGTISVVTRNHLNETRPTASKNLTYVGGNT